jgi:hypothetical protein
MLCTHARFHLAINILVFAVHFHPLLDLLYLFRLDWGDSGERCAEWDDSYACYGGVEIYRRRERRE